MCSQKYTAHCLRATSIQAMSDSGHELRHIMFVTGHKNESSIRSYSRECSSDQKANISNTLSSLSGSARNQLELSHIPIIPPKCVNIPVTYALGASPSTSNNMCIAPMAMAPQSYPSHNQHILSAGQGLMSN